MKRKRYFELGKSKKLIIILLAAAMIGNQSVAYAEAGGDFDIKDETNLKKAELPSADVFNVDFSNGLEDRSPMQINWEKHWDLRKLLMTGN